MKYDAIILIAFGGPEKMEDVRPFLANVLRGRPIPSQRLEAVVHHYELFNGHSPLNEITFRQAKALRVALDQVGVRLPVFIGMRNWHPYLHETLAQMVADGVHNSLGVILSAQQSEAGWGRYQENVATAQKRLGAGAPGVEYIPGWYAHPLFIGAVADLTQYALSAIPAERRTETQLVFTAHSVPTAMSGASGYVAQIDTGARLVAASLGCPSWSVAFQSRSGDPGTSWLEPDIGAVLRQLAAAGVGDVVVVPIGFVCDHIEVVYDLDIQAKQIADELGLHMHRAGTVNDHPLFIQMLADVVQMAVDG